MENDNCYQTILPSQMTQAKLAVEGFVSFIKKRYNCLDDKAMELRLAVHEALLNAILHGNRCNPRQQVELCCIAREEELIIWIRDEGEGFNYRFFLRKNSSPDDLLAERGRGLKIIYGLMDYVYFNLRGNEITMIKKMK